MYQGCPLCSRRRTTPITQAEMTVVDFTPNWHWSWHWVLVAAAYVPHQPLNTARSDVRRYRASRASITRPGTTSTLGSSRHWVSNRGDELLASGRQTSCAAACTPRRTAPVRGREVAYPSRRLTYRYALLLCFVCAVL